MSNRKSFKTTLPNDLFEYIATQADKHETTVTVILEAYIKACIANIDHNETVYIDVIEDERNKFVNRKN